MFRKGCVIALIVVLALGFAGVMAYRNGVHPRLVLWIVKSAWDRTRDLEAMVTSDMEVMGFRVAGTGRLRFLKPDLYDLDLSNARLVAGERQLWVILPAFKTAVRVTGEGMTPSDILGSMIAGWNGGDPTKWVQEATARPQEVILYAPRVIDEQRCWVLEWPARTGERIGGRLYVSQRTRAPIRFDEMDSAGRIVRTYEIRDFRRNIGLTPDDFEYTPMPNYTTLNYRHDPTDPTGTRRMREEIRSRLDALRRMLEQQLPDFLPPGALDRGPGPGEQ